jgi:hypothetical protein
MRRLGLLVLLLAMAATPAMAGQVRVGDTYGLYQAGQGGEFTVINVSGFAPTGYSSLASSQALGSFQTFCIEEQGAEYIYTNTLYDGVQSTNAVFGGGAAYGGSAPPDMTGDPLSVGTGWLYSQFALGTLSGYDYTGANRLASAAAFQNTIWWLENETTVDPGAANPFRNAVLGAFGGSLTAAREAGAWTYNVYAINMWVPGHVGEYAYRRQDQLFYSVPDGGATLMLLGGALVGLGALRRKLGK